MLNGISIGSGVRFPQRGELLMVCAFLFLVRSLEQLKNRWTDFDERYFKMRVSGRVAFLLGLEQ